MRIWDIHPKHLCRNHLLGEHRELHAIWSILTNDKKGYKNHPETKRWENKLAALYGRHEQLVTEMAKRGYRHFSPLAKGLAEGANKQDAILVSKKEQKSILSKKACSCFLPK